VPGFRDFWPALPPGDTAAAFCYTVGGLFPPEDRLLPLTPELAVVRILAKFPPPSPHPSTKVSQDMES